MFLNKYPTLQKRISSVPTVYDSVKNGGISFVEIDKYFKEGETQRNTLTEFNSNNTRILNLEETKAKIASLSYIQERLKEGK